MEIDVKLEPGEELKINGYTYFVSDPSKGHRLYRPSEYQGPIKEGMIEEEVEAQNHDVR